MHESVFFKQSRIEDITKTSLVNLISVISVNYLKTFITENQVFCNKISSNIQYGVPI